ncbi:MAG TPA: NAD(P)/FAD-dependent oxidoreductase [Bryobacteraceae bacterium]|jgi:flavin-dependent dehydrogenase|nr:NAD(P)/FAD-dependent oxidoreductase [Bryobacteraceae bacterium]
MDACDVLIVGGGPAGSSCAWKLRNAGSHVSLDVALDVAILDKQVFPRDKVCGGWITPAVLDELKIHPAEYARGIPGHGPAPLLQPITGFRTGCISGPAIETRYGAPVSYGIRRREFDHYLLRRSGARLIQGVALTSLERSGTGWIANGNIQAQIVVGAGGHFCPVARLTGAKSKTELAVVAQEAEFEMDAAQQAACSVACDTPELYFCADLKGYGWCFRKHNFLNVGLGRMDQHRLSSHVADFLNFLKSAGRLSFDIPRALHGHAYLLYGASARKVVSDGLLLAGDSAGLAYSQSGEGIRPAIESGLLAANTILAARGNYSHDNLERYRESLAARFGGTGTDWATKLGSHLPSRLISSLGRRLLHSNWFAREVVLNRWFLHSGDPALEA